MQVAARLATLVDDWRAAWRTRPTPGGRLTNSAAIARECLATHECWSRPFWRSEHCCARALHARLLGFSACTNRLEILHLNGGAAGIVLAAAEPAGRQLAVARWRGADRAVACLHTGLVRGVKHLTCEVIVRVIELKFRDYSPASQPRRRSSGPAGSRLGSASRY
jgi:hypothetical protein